MPGNCSKLFSNAEMQKNMPWHQALVIIINFKFAAQNPLFRQASAYFRHEKTGGEGENTGFSRKRWFQGPHMRAQCRKENLCY